MGLLYSPLLLVIVSGALPQTAQGESAVNVTGFLKRSVLLPCNCTHMTEGLKWQKDKTSIYANGSMNKKRNTYTDRITKAPNETNKDCSILLNNIKEEDTGVYRCHFKEGGIYSQNTVILEVKKDLEHGVFTEPEQGSSQGSSTDHPQLYLMLIIIPVLLLLFGCIWTVLRKQRQKTLELVNQDDTQP